MILRAWILAWAAVGLQASVPQSFSLVVPGRNPADTARLLTSDASGNLFVVYSSPTPASAVNIHVIKTGPAGNTLASFDFGGSGTDTPYAATTDPQGNLIVAGLSTSPDFPLTAAIRTSGPAFATKLDSQLTKILFSTRLGTVGGGPVMAAASGVATDSAGNIYIIGSTGAGFPTTAGSLEPQAPVLAQAGTIEHGFVMELSAAGDRVVFASYYSGADFVCASGNTPCMYFQPPANSSPPIIYTTPTAIAVDRSGAITIAGTTNSSNVPVTSSAYATQCNCTNLNLASFLARIAPGGASLIWGTYLPINAPPVVYAGSILGAPLDTVASLALDSAGDVVFTGLAASGFPVPSGALQSTFPATGGFPYAGYVAKLDATGSKLLFSTWFGNGNTPPVPEAPASVSVDSSNNIWLTGTVGSASSLPLPAGTPLLGNTYIAGLSADGSSAISMTLVPAGSAGTTIQTSAAGTVTTLGSSGSLLISSGAAGPSLLGVAPSPAFTTGNSVAPRELITLYGIAIGPSAPITAQATAGTLPNTLGGVQVLFDGIPAALLYAGPTQINAIVPMATATRLTTSISVVTPTGKITGPALPVVQTQPAVFSSANGFAVAVNQDGTMNGFSNPAPAGTVVAIWLTGGGANELTADNQINTTLSGNPYSVSILSTNPRIPLPEPTSLEILYAGDAPQAASGVIQVNFLIPPWGGETYEVQIGNATTTFNLWTLAAPGA